MVHCSEHFLSCVGHCQGGVVLRNLELFKLSLQSTCRPILDRHFLTIFRRVLVGPVVKRLHSTVKGRRIRVPHRRRFRFQNISWDSNLSVVSLFSPRVLVAILITAQIRGSISARAVFDL
ncbi:hypothetical protein BaRGS_00023246 [Batillaria attramentaria]|uniref:Uncharacterized protein n=1 Tax=Batillaria attramentaria TaxID=370345 RepID=A0ABD0KEE3_9CAEN